MVKMNIAISKVERLYNVLLLDDGTKLCFIITSFLIQKMKLSTGRKVMVPKMNSNGSFLIIKITVEKV